MAIASWAECCARHASLGQHAPGWSSSAWCLGLCVEVCTEEATGLAGWRGPTRMPLYASSMFECRHCSTIWAMSRGCGWSHTCTTH